MTKKQDQAGSLKIQKKPENLFEKPQFDYRSGRTEESVFVEGQKIDRRIRGVVQAAGKHDVAERELRNETRLAIQQSSWLSTHTIPSEEAIYEAMDRATTTLEIKSLSRSQKTKRGKKFKKKAQQQADMINIMQKCHWERKGALKDLLEHGKNARLGYDITESVEDGKTVEGYLQDTDSDTFLENFQDGQVDRSFDGEKDEYIHDKNETVSLFLQDLSFYYEEKKGMDDKGETVLPVTKYHYQTLEKIANPETRDDGYMKVLEELDSLDFSIFNYKSNEEFMKNEGDKAFIKRYSALRAFRHAGDIVSYFGMKKLGRKRYDVLMGKALLIVDILEDYEDRAMLLQSPYYVLLAGKDLDSIKTEELEEKIKKTNDPLAKNFLQRVLRRRWKKDEYFGIGVKADKILKDGLKNAGDPGLLGKYAPFDIWD
ncbi:MAG: hypothetical protein K6G83_14025 [Lachnospiraceae bacterium]|nr:hypothetical protein [Lachnospiraceae bacterium]